MREFTLSTSELPHQSDAVNKLAPARVGALFADMGVGKSRMTIGLVHKRLHKIDRVIWFCPVSLKETVRYEILKHTDCDESALCVFGERTSTRNVDRSAFWHIVGIESISASSRAVFTAANLITERTFVIVDESSYIKGHGALRTERITRMAQPARYRLILNGTPLSQGYIDLYAQMRFLDPRILGYKSFYSFAANHLEYHPDYPGMVVRAHNTKYLAAKMAPYVYQVTKEECLTLPEKLHETYACSLSTQQRQAYREAKELLLDDVKPDDWDSLFIFRLFTMLQGIVCGYWAKPDGTVIDLVHNRVVLLLEVLRRIEPTERVVIWTRHHFAVRQIVAELTEAYGAGTVAEFHGGLTEKRRNAELDRWRRDGRFLVATTGTGGHGLTLIEARYAIFYENGFKYSERVQAEDRQHRIGQERRPIYIDLTSGTGIEDRIFQALARKGNALKAFRQEVDKVKRTNKDRLRQLVKSL